LRELSLARGGDLRVGGRFGEASINRARFTRATGETQRVGVG
jgi:hypothetical protein